MMRMLLTATALAALGISSAAKASQVVACDFTPFGVEASFVEIDIDGNIVKSGTDYIEPGHCEPIDLSNSPLTSVHFYAEATNSVALKQAEMHQEFKTRWRGKPRWGAKHGLEVCVAADSTEVRGLVRENRTCPKNQRKVSFDDKLETDVNGTVSWNIIDPVICNLTSDLSCLDEPLETFVPWLMSLKTSLEAQSPYYVSSNPWGSRVFPTGAGVRFFDVNGPFTSGVEVNRAISITPLKTPIQLRPGDTIHRFNGLPIFNHEELAHAYYNHGVKNGVGEEYVARIERSGHFFDIYGFMYFDEDVVGPVFLNSRRQCRLNTSALVLQTLNEFSFSQLDHLNCLGHKAFNQSSDYKSCVFANEQFLAAYAQFCPGETLAGRILGSLYLPGRATVEKSLGKALIKGTSKASRLVRGVTVEITEEAARAYASQPAGYSKSESLNSIARNAEAGVAIGLGFRFAQGLIQ